MKTSLEKIQNDFGVPLEIGIEGIAKGGSVLPQIVIDNDQKVCQVTFCDSIAGGQNEVRHMPKELSLVRYEWIGGELHEFRASYTINEK